MAQKLQSLSKEGGGGGCGACRGSDQAQMWKGLGSNQCWRGCGGKELVHCWWGWKSVLPLWRTVGSVSEGGLDEDVDSVISTAKKSSL